MKKVISKTALKKILDIEKENGKKIVFKIIFFIQPFQLRFREGFRLLLP